MSYVTITDVKIANPISPFLAPFAFEITLECIAELKDDLEFKVIYVSSPTNKSKDQVLEQVSVGPIPLGINRFTLEAPAPNPALIPSSDLLGCTVVSLQVSYMDCEFVRIGYLVNIEHPELVAATAAATAAGLEAPSTLPGGLLPMPQDLVRNILADKPRVTRFHLNWENPKDKYYSMDPANADDHGQDCVGGLDVEDESMMSDTTSASASTVGGPGGPGGMVQAAAGAAFGASTAGQQAQVPAT